MKRKWYWTFCISLVFAVVLLNCETDSSTPNNEPKILVIEGIPSDFDSSATHLKCWIMDKSKLYTDVVVASCSTTEIIDSSATFELRAGYSSARWIGTGNYSIVIDGCDYNGDGNSLPRYIYNNGNELPYFTNSKSNQELDIKKIQTYPFRDTVSRIAASKFKPDSSWDDQE